MFSCISLGSYSIVTQLLVLFVTMFVCLFVCFSSCHGIIVPHLHIYVLVFIARVLLFHVLSVCFVSLSSAIILWACNSLYKFKSCFKFIYVIRGCLAVLSQYPTCLYFIPTINNYLLHISPSGSKKFSVYTESHCDSYTFISISEIAFVSCEFWSAACGETPFILLLNLTLITQCIQPA